MMKTATSTSFILFLGFGLLLAYFNGIDVYHHHFFTQGWTIFFYNVIRIFFILYLIWLFYAAGDLFLRFILRDKKNTATLENALLSFFAGVGVWHIVLLFIGFAGFYTRSVMMTMSILLFFFSLPRLRYWLRCLQTYHKPIYWQGWVVFLIPLFFFLITKGLYPAGCHDYYNHYFPYYLRVIESGNILPNDVWYHFYYSKGDGLFFLSMLLTDPLAPQLATTALIIIGAATTYSILRSANETAGNKWQLLPWIGAALYLAFLIYTPGPQRMEGWADLEKAHEPASVLMLAMIWMTMQLAKAEYKARWGIALLLLMSGIVIINPFLAPIAAIYLGLAASFFYYRQKKRGALWLAGGMIITGAWFLFLSAVNFYLTGVPDEQKLLIYLPFINFQQVNHWGVLMEVLKFHWDRTGMVANLIPIISGHFLHVYFTYIRLDVWGPLLLFACLLLGINSYSPSKRFAMLKGLDKTALFTCGGFLLLVLVISLIIGRDQHYSYYRFTIFSYAPMLIFCLLIILPNLHKKRFASLSLIIGFILCWLFLKPFMNVEIGKIQSVFTNALKFATGQYSLADGYRHQQGWPGRAPWGAIYPGAEAAWAQLPPNTRIWSLHENSYCMLPDCRMETYPSYRLSAHSATIFYGKPQQAKAYLQEEGLNYFFISHVLNLTDPLPLTPLFSPAHIADYLGIVWTNGQDSLLTWREHAKYPIDATWLANYKRTISHSRIVQSFPYQQMGTVLATFAQKSRLEKSDIPWYHAGWI